jgi:phosphate-selective porin OprO and OprP
MKAERIQLHRAWFAGALMMALCAAPGLRAEDTNTTDVINQLLKRIEELELKVRVLENRQGPEVLTNAAPARPQPEQREQPVTIPERNRELDSAAAEAKAKETPKISIGEQGISLASANGDFAVQLKGVLQVDSRSFFDDGGIPGNNGFLLRRARPILQGTVFRDFDFLFVPDFGTGNNGGNNGTQPTPQIYDAYLNYRYNPALQLQAGKFKAPVGLEQLQADANILFNERALPTDLVPNRDIGFELHGDLFRGISSYAAGIFDGVGDARNSTGSDFDDAKAVAGRVFFVPFKKSSVPAVQGLGFGVGGSYASVQGTNTLLLPATTGGALPGFATVGQQQFFAYSNVVAAAGDLWRLSPQGYYYYGPFGLLGEYVISDQGVSRAVAPAASARLQNTGWQVAAGWVLTGEDATYGGLVPRRPFSPARGNWGAWQIVARFSELDVDPAAFPLFADPTLSARSAKEWSVGLNWFLNRNVRVNASFAHTTFDGGGGRGTTAPANVTRQPENVLFTRVQLAF